MIVIPAIDLKGGQVVRLEQGVMEKDTHYSSDPAGVARRWVDMGAELIHLVDLEGAFKGRPVNDDAIASIRSSVEVRLELGGGIRDMETINRIINLGIDDVILGTVARKDPDLVKRACDAYPERIIVGVDARAGKVAVEGWAEETELEAAELAKRFEDVGVSRVIYTEIERDGMLTGVSTANMKSFAEQVNLPVIASGGVSGIDDIRNLLPLEEYGVTGVITGRAIYEGRLDLKEAIELCRTSESA